MTRQEFENILNNLFFGLAFPSDTRNFQQAVITNSESLYEGFATNYLRAVERINFYLSEWDAAPNQSAKDAVAGSVVSDLGNASVNPDNAYMWPPILGHFGDTKGPIDTNNVSRTYSVQVDGKTVGNTLIMTAPTGQRFVPQLVNFTVLQVSGLSVVATCSIGTNPASYNNIMGATLLTGLTAQNNKYGISLTGIITTVSPAESVYCRVSIPSTATTYDILASVTGFLIDV